jgi:hypothetical protein
VFADRSLVTTHGAGLIVYRQRIKRKPQTYAHMIDNRLRDFGKLRKIPEILQAFQQQHSREEVLIAAADQYPGKVQLLLNWRE